MTSISPSRFASWAVRFVALFTSFWARLAFRPWTNASARIEAAASLTIFRARSWLTPVSPSAIGVADEDQRQGSKATHVAIIRSWSAVDQALIHVEPEGPVGPCT